MVKEKNNDEDENENKGILIKTPSSVYITIGDITIASNKSSVKEVQKIAIDTLRKKSVINYLTSFEKKRLLSTPMYIE